LAMKIEENYGYRRKHHIMYLGENELGCGRVIACKSM